MWTPHTTHVLKQLVEASEAFTKDPDDHQSLKLAQMYASQVLDLMEKPSNQVGQDIETLVDREMNSFMHDPFRLRPKEVYENLNTVYPRLLNAVKSNYFEDAKTSSIIIRDIFRSEECSVQDLCTIAIVESHGFKVKRCVVSTCLRTSSHGHAVLAKDVPPNCLAWDWMQHKFGTKEETKRFGICWSVWEKLRDKYHHEVVDVQECIRDIDKPLLEQCQAHLMQEYHVELDIDTQKAQISPAYLGNLLLQKLNEAFEPSGNKKRARVEE